jgi:hypothetical protein
MDPFTCQSCSPTRRQRAAERLDAVGAGWSSPVARQAHNLKVTGSNPVPATNIMPLSQWLSGFFCVCVPAGLNAVEAPWKQPAGSRRLEGAKADFLLLFGGRGLRSCRMCRPTQVVSDFASSCTDLRIEPVRGLDRREARVLPPVLPAVNLGGPPKDAA